MNARPIIFSAPMLRAILAGEKTQTRRVIKVPPSVHADASLRPTPDGGDLYCPEYPDEGVLDLTCPYGPPGDHLWVREGWAPCELTGYAYRATDEDIGTWKWRSPIFMPRTASRITLQVQAVRVERVQEITEANAEAEGCRAQGGISSGPMEPEEWDGHTAIDKFQAVWHDLYPNGPKSWETDPWVWVIEFERVEGES